MHVVQEVRAGRVGSTGGYTGWVPGGLYRYTQPPCSRRSHTSEAGPVSPCRGLEWVGVGPDVPAGWGRLQDHPCGARSVPLAPPCPGPSECPLLANRARIDLILLNYGQNDEVSPKYVEKAYHSPCFQKPLVKSPLEIPRFPF